MTDEPSNLNQITNDKTQQLGQTTFKLDQNDQSVSFQNGQAGGVVYKVGDVIGDSYKLLAPIGQGGMGVVFLAEHLLFQERYALKLLSPDQVNATSWQRFEVEGKLLAKLEHPNIVKIFNMGIDGRGCPYYVMELLPGSSLDQLIDNPNGAFRLTQMDLLKVYLQACAGLGSAHRKGIVHRDVKPSNIIVTASPANNAAVKIVDFGIASLTASEATQSLTREGEIFGSPLYMSPEQCMGQKVDPRSDIYSMGCALYHSLTGRPPHVGTNALHTVILHQQETAPSLASANRGAYYSRGLESFVAKLLQKEPSERYQNMEQVAHDLERLIEGKSIAGAKFGVEANEELDGGDFSSSAKINNHQGLTSVESNRSGLRPVFAPLILFAFFITVIGAVAYFVLQKNHSGSGSAIVNFATASGDQKIDKNEGTNSGKVLSAVDESLDNVDPLKAKNDAPIARAQFAAALKMKAKNFAADSLGLRKNKRHLYFPPRLQIGEINIDGARQNAFGVLTVPANARIQLTAGQPIQYCPEFLDTFNDTNIVEAKANQIENNLTEVLLHMRGWSNLRVLKIADCKLDATSLPALSQLKHLDALYFDQVSLTLPEIIAAKKLRELPIIGFKRIPDVEPIVLFSLSSKNLRLIDLCQIPITRAIIDAIKNSSTITTIHIESATLTDQDVKELSETPNLTDIILTSRLLTEKSFLCFVGKTKMHLIHLNGSEGHLQPAAARFNKLVGGGHAKAD